MSTDYFAELFVAGLFADSGWNVYFPHRDRGFDFIVTKQVGNIEIIRPVQVKGKYPSTDKTDKTVYGYVGELTKIHRNMVLAIPYFDNIRLDGADLVAFMPRDAIKNHKRGFKCEPAFFKDGKANARRDFGQYFGQDGLRSLEQIIE